MPEENNMKPSIVSNIEQANKNVEVFEEKNVDLNKEQLNVLSSIHAVLKEQNKGKQKEFNRTKEREKNKIFTKMTDLLSGIKDGIKEKTKGFSDIFKVIIIAALGTLFAVIKRIEIVVKTVFTAVKFLWNVIKKLGSKLFKIFNPKFLKNTKFGKFLKGIKTNFFTFVESFKGIGKRISGIFKTIGKPFENVGKVLKKGKGIISSIKKFINPIVKFIKPLMGGFKFLKAVPIIGNIIAVVMTIIDGIKGFFKAGEWFGKKKGEKVNIGERISAVVGSILSGLTFGLLGSGKEFANKIYDFGKGILDSVKSIIEWFQNFNLEELGSKVVGWFLNMWNRAKEMFEESLQTIGDIGLVVWNWFKEKWNQSIETGKEMLQTIGDIGLVVWNWFKEKWNQTIEFVKTGIDGLIDIGKIIGDFGKDLINNIVDGVKSIFSTEGDESFVGKIKKIFMNLATTIGNLVGQLWNWITEKVSNIGGIFKGLFDFKKDEKQTDNKPNISSIEDIKTASLQSPLTRKEKTILSEEKKRLESEGIKIKKPEEGRKQFIGLKEGMSEAQKMQTMMSFLLNDFSTIQAKKIAAAIGKGDTKKPEDIPVTPVIVR